MARDVLAELQALLREFTGDKTMTIARDMRLRADLGLDSYDLASLLWEVEERFGVEIPDRALLEMLVVGDAVGYIEGHM